MSLEEYVRILGRGQGRSRSMTRTEARDAMSLMLAGDAAPEAVGAVLMLMRMKGETAEEIAGFTEASQAVLPNMSKVDLDWPSYAAGRSRGLPWFLLSARLVSQAGYRVLLHGWNGAGNAVRNHLDAAGIAVASDASEVATALARCRLCYLPLETAHPALFKLLSLRSVLGLRSCVNTVCRMLNPGRSPASVQGVFHPSYRMLQADAADILGVASLTVIKGGGGEAERHPGKNVAGFGLRNNQAWKGTYPALRNEQVRLSETTSASDLSDLWTGEVADAAATDIVIGTAAVALDTLGVEDSEKRARDLWRARREALAA